MRVYKMDLTIDYDAIIFEACPNYSFGLEKVASLILPNTRELVSLGTGTGNLEAVVFDRVPEIRITGFEWNQNWLDRAIGKLNSRFSGVYADITQVGLPTSNGVISSLTLHHITDKDKLKLFERVYDSLSTGGRFVNYDIIKAESNEEHDAFVDYVTGHMRSKGFSSDFIEEERRILNGVGEGADIPMTLPKQQEFLERFGFKFTLDWRDHLFVVYQCDKD